MRVVSKVGELRALKHVTYLKEKNTFITNSRAHLAQ